MLHGLMGQVSMIEKSVMKTLSEILDLSAEPNIIPQILDIMSSKVTDKTTAGSNGKTIACPNCKNKLVVYHFSWIAMECPKCRKMVKKHSWELR